MGLVFGSTFLARLCLLSENKSNYSRFLFRCERSSDSRSPAAADLEADSETLGFKGCRGLCVCQR